jgi:hypothetical protein
VNVYVESNFVLELALDQEDRDSCERLLEHARRGVIQLVIPGCALLEPNETLTRRVRDWERLAREVESEFTQLRRNAVLQAEVDALAELTVRAVKLATDRHEEVRAQILTHARVLSIDSATLLEAERVRASYAMELPDAVMLASVLLDLRSESRESIFVNKNSKDFADPSVQAELADRACKYIGSFRNGLARVESSSNRRTDFDGNG